MSILGNRVLGGAGQQPYTVGRSLRFRSSASAYLNRTPSVAGNQQKWTWSAWVKRGALGSAGVVQNLFTAGTGDNARTLLFFQDNNTLNFVHNNTGTYYGTITTAVFRDCSAWYHILVSVDTTQATATNRVRIYINSVEQTATSTFGSGYIQQNINTYVNSTSPQVIGANPPYSSIQFLDGYLAEVNLIDGQQLTPSSFGAYDNNGVWQPRKYGGTYGTNGFYLPFSNTTSTTTLVQDASGNGNNWTANNISLVTGTGRYLGSISGSIDLVNGGPPSSMFKGSTAQPGPYPQPGATLTWNPYASVPFTSTARVYIGVDVNGPANGLVVNSTNYGNGGIAGNAFGWVNVASAGSPITSISWSRASGGSQGMRVFAVEIDGVILADSPSWNPLYDSMTDSPTLSASSSNYAVLNPLNQNSSGLSGANLNVSSTSAFAYASSTFNLPSTGKWYWEYTDTSTAGLSGERGAVGFALQGTRSTTTYFGQLSTDWGYLGFNGQLLNNAVATSYGNTWTQNDVVGIAVDCATGKFWFSKNGTFQASGDPAAGTNQAGTISGDITTYCPIVGNIANVGGYSMVGSANFGQRPFSYTPPSGFNALNTYNLPQPTIMNGAKYMAATLTTGTGGVQNISNGLNNTTGVVFQPDLIWWKSRSNVTNQIWVNSISGAGPFLRGNTTDAELQGSGLTSFNSNGFSVNGSFDNTYTFVSWQWNAGSGVTSTNTSGTISSLVSVNPSAGFSMVSYVGTGAVATVGHGLGVAPNMIIWKNRSSVENWVVYHSSLGATGNVYLNLTNGFSTDSTTQNNTAPTSSVFTVATSGATNGATRNLIAYCWTAIAGYSSFGSYSGNGNSDGVYIYLGFRPRFVMVKNTTVGTPQSWWVQDSSRSTYNVVDAYLQPNQNETEKSIYAQVDFLSNGIKFRTSDNFANGSGQSYIYAAFAENPFKISRAR